MTKEQTAFVDELRSLMNLLKNMSGWDVEFYGWVLESGRFFEPQRKPGKYRFGPAKQCYANSNDLRRAEPALVYCEGVVACDGVPMPVPHAWLSDGGKVVDVTLRTPARLYFGVPFDAEAMMDGSPLHEAIVRERINGRNRSGEKAGERPRSRTKRGT
jgi:hypothetical protein